MDEELLSVISDLGTLLIAFFGVVLALVQLRRASRDAKASRMAEVSLKLYEIYTDQRIRDARGAAELIAHSPKIPKSAEEYGELYGDKEFVVPEPPHVSLDTHMRRLLRFYNQAAVLLEKGLVDDDFVLGFVGPGLKSSWDAVKPAIEWVSLFYGGASGKEKTKRRRIYEAVPRLYERYLKWEAKSLTRKGDNSQSTT